MITLGLLQVFLVVFLIAANGFFVASEFALVSVRDTRVQQLIEAGRVGSRTVQKLLSRLDTLLAGVQFGVTMTSLGLGIAGEPFFSQVIRHGIRAVTTSIPESSVHLFSLAAGFILVSFFHVVLGEIVPKSLALQRAERVALVVAKPMDVFITLAQPALGIISRSANVVLRIFGSRPMREAGVHSPDELKMMVTASRRVGMLPQGQEDMILRALELQDVTVREIMVPRNRIFSLPSDLPLEETMRRVVEEQHSRVPVYDAARGPEHIIGLLYSKDVSRYMHYKLTAPQAPPQTMTVANLMRDIMVVPETKPVSGLLEEFRARKRHLAVVVDEFGTTVGLVTTEDALEQLVGELEDEFDVVPQPPRGLTTGSAVLDGAESIRDLENHHKLGLPRDQGFETLAGFLLNQLGRIPTGGEIVDFGGHTFTVLSMQGKRISKVKVEKK